MALLLWKPCAAIHRTSVFTTAYAEYRDQAFRANACDYLLKPVIPRKSLRASGTK